MKVADTKEIRERLNTMREKRRTNENTVNQVLDMLSRNRIFTHDPMLQKAAIEEQKVLNAQNSPLGKFTVQEAMISVVLNSVIENNTSTEGSLQTIPPCIYDFIIKSSNVFDVATFEELSFFQEVKYEKGTYGEFEFTSNSTAENELFQYANPYYSNGYLIPRLGMFNRRFRFPRIRRNKEIWKSLDCEAISTARHFYEVAKGRVLILGCDIGYISYLASEKSNVKEVVVLERDQAVIDLFEEYILPQFCHSCKIDIIQANPLDIMRIIGDGMFNMIYVDLCKDCFDLYPYIRLRFYTSTFKKTKVVYRYDDYMRERVTEELYRLIDIVYSEGKNHEMSAKQIPVDRFEPWFQSVIWVLDQVNIDSLDTLNQLIDGGWTKLHF